MTDRAVPNLPSRDFDATISFYGGFGFEAVYRSEEWLILQRGGLELEFFAFPELDAATSSFMASLRVDEADDLYERIRNSGVEERAHGHPRLSPVRVQPWGQRAGFLVDVDGTQLHLIENAPE